MYTVYAPLSKCAFIFHVLDPGHLDCVRLGGGEEGQGGGDWGWLGCLPSCRWRQREGEMKKKILIFNSFCHRRSPWPARLKTRKEKLPTLSPCLFTVSDFVYIFYLYHIRFHKSPCPAIVSGNMAVHWCWFYLDLYVDHETRADSMSFSL